jgi:peptidoglycan/xylan/chitin deacetylase (PgdA/CDA1 family)
VTILRYHSVQDEPEHYANSIGAGIIHPTPVFSEQMELLTREYNPVTLDDILAFVHGEKRLPRDSVAVTFDDGFADNFEVAAPVLSRFGIRATFYVTVSSIEGPTPLWFCRLRHAFHTTQLKTWFDSADGCARHVSDAAERKAAFLVASKRCARSAGYSQEQILTNIERELEVDPLSARDCPMLSWDQIRGLHHAGHIVGSHTLTHPNLACVGDDDLQGELIESKNKLERQLGVPAVHFSYPSPIMQPHFTERTVVFTRQAGYQTAVTCIPRPIRRGDDPWCFGRISVPCDRQEYLWSLGCTPLGCRT